MRVVNTVKDLRAELQLLRSARKKIALVPTMGNLHAGHSALIAKGQAVADVVVVSIFVNPKQFVAGEDFETYPRSLAADLALLGKQQVDFVFAPTTDELYPPSMAVEIKLPALDAIYCGQSRPGHFQGVALIVSKLFNIVAPEFAVFGEKDYQQLILINNLVTTLNFPLTIIAVPTVREDDGLAMSSRNNYLTEAQRAVAPQLYQALLTVATAIKAGDKDYQTLTETAAAQLAQSGFKVAYVSVCDAKTLAHPSDHNRVIIAAAQLGRARLIDNILI